MAGPDRSLADPLPARVATAVQAAYAALRRIMHTNLRSLAWGLCPDLADEALGTQASTRLMLYIVDNGAMLKGGDGWEEQLGELIDAALQEPGFSLSQTQWIAWFRRHQDDFYNRQLYSKIYQKDFYVYRTTMVV